MKTLEKIDKIYWDSNLWIKHSIISVRKEKDVQKIHIFWSNDDALDTEIYFICTPNTVSYNTNDICGSLRSFIKNITTDANWMDFLYEIDINETEQEGDFIIKKEEEDFFVPALILQNINIRGE